MKTFSERMGSFFLGAEYDLEKESLSDTLVHYDARDLTTHAVCVGMTGSGKTGLCIGLLEEAALDRVPAIIIDPKGDMTNLLLQFEDLEPEDFLPWVNDDDARRRGLSREDYAASIAGLWRDGLGKWGIGPERIKKLKDAVEYTIYTPGSDAGVPVNVLGSLSAPPASEDLPEEHFRDRIDGVVSALLGLVGIKADPVRSRESILLATIFDHYWKKGKDIDLAELIRAIQKPPVRQLGVFDVDTFFPEKDRFELAMALNSLIASPSFGLWRTGASLDVDTLLFKPDGTPRHSVFYIAHLSDAERMFFVTLLLESVVTWVRRQTGTTSLRALLYFDEIFGYLPPTAEPPSKRPLLTLLKQARAFGLGSVLVTQNPVDIDYKALTNTGTWFIGKLQAERDKARLLAGLNSVLGTDTDYKKIISQLDSRVFLMHNVHEDRPTIFHTRWAMSYLRGPLTRPQIRQLTADRVDPTEVMAPAAVRREPVVAEDQPAGHGLNTSPPSLGPAIDPLYVPISLPQAEALRALDIDQPTDVQLFYELAVLARTNVRFLDRDSGTDLERSRIVVESHLDATGGIDWGRARVADFTHSDLLADAQTGSQTDVLYGQPIDGIDSPSDLSTLKKSLSEWLYRQSRLPLLSNKELDVQQKPGETEAAFRSRLSQAAREQRDAEVDKLEDSFARKMDRIEDRLERKVRAAETLESTYESRKQEEWVSIGESVLGVFLGRRSRRRLSSAAGKRRMTSQAKDRMETTREEAASLREDLIQLQADLEEAVQDISLKWEGAVTDVETVELRPRRVDVQIPLLTVAWLPYWRVASEGRGESVPAYGISESDLVS